MIWEDAYNREIARAFLRMRGSVPDWLKALDEEHPGIAFLLRLRIARNLAFFLVQVERHFEGEITAENVEELAQAARRDFAALSVGLEALARSTETEAITIAQNAHLSGIQQAVNIAGATVINQRIALQARQDFAGFAEAVRARTSRIGFTTNLQQAVRQRVVLARRSMDQFLRASVGQSADDVVQTIVRGIMAQDEAIVGQYRQLGGRLRGVGRNIGRIRAGLFPNASQLPEDIRRNIVHGVNAMHHEAMVYGYSLSPMVGAVRWRTSHRHSEPDACDLLEEANVYNIGPGLYHPIVCPGLVHPWCGCQAQPVYRPVEKWSEPKPVPRRPEPVRGPLPSLSARRRSRAYAMANRAVQLAYRDWDKERAA